MRAEEFPYTLSYILLAVAAVALVGTMVMVVRMWPRTSSAGDATATP